jgi:AcrR family transcriptional regulator
VKAFERLDAAARRAQLLELGVRLFSERPYDDFSMDDVAELAGVSKGLIYHYFPTKRAFYMEALRAAVAEMTRLIEPAPNQSPAEALRGGLDAYLRYVQEHAAAYRAVLRGGIGSDPEVAAIADGFREVVYQRILATTGQPEPSPALRVALRGWIGLVEAASLEWGVSNDPERESLISLLTESLRHLTHEAARITHRA